MNIIFMCPYDGEILSFAKGSKRILYRCPRYYRRNRKNDEPSCNTLLSVKTANEIKIDVSINASNGNLKEGQHYITNKIRYKIYQIKENIIKIYVEGYYGNDI